MFANFDVGFWLVPFFFYYSLCVCVCVCVCEGERGEFVTVEPTVEEV